MISILIVSHSKQLGEELIKLLKEVKSEDFHLASIGGLENGKLFGSSGSLIKEKILKLDQGQGVLLICDLGSSVLNSKLAISLLSNEQQERVKILNAPFLEGSFVAVVNNQPNRKIKELIKIVEEEVFLQK